MKTASRRREVKSHLPSTRTNVVEIDAAGARHRHGQGECGDLLVRFVAERQQVGRAARVIRVDELDDGVGAEMQGRDLGPRREPFADFFAPAHLVAGKVEHARPRRRGPARDGGRGRHRARISTSSDAQAHSSSMLIGPRSLVRHVDVRLRDGAPRARGARARRRSERPPCRRCGTRACAGCGAPPPRGRR